MSRGIGEIETAQRLVPESLLPVAEAVTRLGDLSVLVAVTIVAVLVLERDRAVHLLGVVVGGLALLAGLKAALSFGRPPSELHLIDTATTGFPSGHALGAAVVYGGLALSLDAGTRRTRLALVAPLVAAISLSRVVLGVHYLVDIAVGLSVAIGYLWTIERVGRRRPDRALAVGAGLGLAAVVVGIAFAPTPRTSCLGAMCIDRDVVAPAAAGVGAVLAWNWTNRPGASRPLAWRAALPVGLVGGGALVWTGSTLLSNAIAAGIGAAVLVVVAGSCARLRNPFA